MYYLDLFLYLYHHHLAVLVEMGKIKCSTQEHTRQYQFMIEYYVHQGGVVVPDLVPSKALNGYSFKMNGYSL